MKLSFVTLSLLASLAVSGCSKADTGTQPGDAKETAPAKEEAPKQAEEKPVRETTVSTEVTPTKEKKMTVVVIETSKGNIIAELDDEKAPVSVKNFLEYVDENFYDNTIFHRVIKDFMVQGGGFTEDMNQKRPKAPIKIESDNGLKNDRGTLAMARTQVPNSATSQFFINHKDNAFLNYTAPTAQGYGYAVFGRVIDGMDVVDEIAGVVTRNAGMHQNVPAEAVVIKKIYRKAD